MLLKRWLEIPIIEESRSFRVSARDVGKWRFGDMPHLPKNNRRKSEQSKSQIDIASYNADPIRKRSRLSIFSRYPDLESKLRLK
jgi:hypothetical protein